MDLRSTRTLNQKPKKVSSYALKSRIGAGMASKKSQKFKRQPRHYRKKGLPGKKENRFYIDEMSGHPFVSQSKHGVFFYGHNVTHSPLRNFDGSIKRKYRRFPRRIVPGDPRASYFDTTLFRINNAPKPGKTTGRLKRKNWRLSKANKEILRKVERERVKRAKKK